MSNPIGLWFWILMLIWLLLGAWVNFPRGDNRAFGPFGGSLLLFVLLALIGWHVFGSPFAK